MDKIIENMFVIMVMVMAASFFILGIYYTYKNKKEKSYSGITSGKIIDIIMREEHDSDRGCIRYYYALCEYMVGETKCARETNIGASEPKYKIGDTVIIHYNPNNCHEAYIEGDNNSKVKAILFFYFRIYNFHIGISNS